MGKEKDKATMVKKQPLVKELTAEEMLEELKKIPAKQFATALQVFLNDEKEPPHKGLSSKVCKLN